MDAIDLRQYGPMGTQKSPSRLDRITMMCQAGLVIQWSQRLLWLTCFDPFDTQLCNLVGGWATPLKNMVRQLGWWHSQYFWENAKNGNQLPPTSNCYYPMAHLRSSCVATRVATRTLPPQPQTAVPARCRAHWLPLRALQGWRRLAAPCPGEEASKVDLVWSTYIWTYIYIYMCVCMEVS